MRVRLRSLRFHGASAGQVRVLLRAALLAAIVAFTSLLGAAQQQPAPSATFQVEVNFVDIDAVVTDERGNFIGDLTKDDFELLDDGKPQEISAFSLVDIPMPSAGTRPPGGPQPSVSDVNSNAQPISGRLYVIVLDDLNVAPLRTKVVVNAARQLIERHFGPNDMAAIMYTSGRTDGAQEFTSERAALLAAIDKFQGRKLRSTVIEKADQYFQQHLKELEVNQSDPDDPDAPSGPPQSGTVRGPMGYSDITTDPDDFERGHRAEQVLGALKKLAEVMGGIRGRRKAVVMFSEGIDYPIYDIFGSQAATSVMMATRDAIAAAARANVSFFSVDPRGLVGMTSEAIELNAAADVHLGFDAKGLLADMYLSAGQPAHARGGDGRLCRGELEQHHHRPQPHRPAEQHVLRARLLPEGRQARRAFSQDRSPHQAARTSRVGAKGLRLAEEHQRRGSVAAGARTRAWPRTRGLDADVERTARDLESTASAERFDDDRARSAVQGRGKRRVGGGGDRSGRRPSPLRRAAQQDVCRRSRAERCLRSTSGAGSMAAAFTSSIWRCGRTRTSACAARSCG